jgi:oxygen-independent coproporphyrinogen-3 oxidase
MPYEYDLAYSFISVILKQIAELEPGFSSVYIGGGTPSILDIRLLDRFLSGLKGIIEKDVEFTIEVNPESIDEDKLKLFLDRGVNRISIGVQSFEDIKLKLLGRVHDAVQAGRVIELAEKSGFRNISIDMIFGVNGEDLSLWQEDLQKLTGFNVNHLSCYSLTYEKGTSLFNMKDKGVNEEILADMYRFAMAYLPTKGLQHYEVSNFAKPGFECRHNLNYWDNNSYIGLGPSGVSCIDGMRSENISDVIEYIKMYEKGLDLKVSKEKLPPLESAKETASLKIRTRQGINYDWFKHKTGFDFNEIEKDAVSDLIEQGLIESRDGRVQLTQKGFLFSDTVSAAFL